MSNEDVAFQEQFRLLLETQRDPQGQPYSLAAVAKAVGLSEQALAYLLDGRSQQPRLDTLRRLCRFFQISLDYFQCETAAACRAFLAQQSPTLTAVAHESETLSSGGQHNVLSILEWLRRARPSSQH